MLRAIIEANSQMMITCSLSLLKLSKPSASDNATPKHGLAVRGLKFCHHTSEALLFGICTYIYVYIYIYIAFSRSLSLSLLMMVTSIEFLSDHPLGGLGPETRGPVEGMSGKSSFTSKGCLRQQFGAASESPRLSLKGIYRAR